ncbi:hypothetical protein GCM10011581_48110 [Saccharopolyspora subtropica]|uniref:Uncharacterized protein n=1 Tax=Saccharopolyspora thermophila TaxID=89367 RepID=A0A917K924_9PSEU|nr:hypothetical protein [Saccharopolyspora subtropica]GGJ05370.1 hypothetical protein GCM10011581_48110 [Saccharopolyspora subtropica]
MRIKKFQTTAAFAGLAVGAVLLTGCGPGTESTTIPAPQAPTTQLQGIAPGQKAILAYGGGYGASSVDSQRFTPPVEALKQPSPQGVVAW